jgi:hypothetical protein
MAESELPMLVVYSAISSSARETFLGGGLS